MPRLISHFSTNHQIKWTTNTLDETAFRTIHCVCHNLKVPDQINPDTATTYLVAHKQEYHGIYYHLVIIDTHKDQCWYLDIIEKRPSQSIQAHNGPVGRGPLCA